MTGLSDAEFYEVVHRIISTRSRTHFKDAGVIHLGARAPTFSTECGVEMDGSCYVPLAWTPEYEMEVTCHVCLRRSPPLISLWAIRESLLKHGRPVDAHRLRVLLGWHWLKMLDGKTDAEVYKWVCKGAS